LPRFKIADVTLQQCDVPFDDVDAALAARLAQSMKMGRVRLACEVGLLFKRPSR
jgi:hypothetical protein